MDITGLIIGLGVWIFIIPVLYFFIILLCVISISHKLGDIRDSLEKISKNSGN